MTVLKETDPTLTVNGVEIPVGTHIYHNKPLCEYCRKEVDKPIIDSGKAYCSVRGNVLDTM